MNKPDICVFHANCLDGYTAAWAVWQKWPDIEFLAAQYGDEAPDVEGRAVLIVDFSYPEDVMREMAAAALWVHVCDHHEKARPILATLVNDGVLKATFDLERSGAALAWDYAWGAGRMMPAIVEVVQDRDLWRFKIPGTREISAVLASYDESFDEWTRLAKLIENPATRAALISEGAGIVRAKDREIEQALVATARRVRIAGHDCLCANVPYTFASEAGHKLANVEGAEFGAVWFLTEAGDMKFSLRSRDEFDVNALASLFGGGGHKAAAGFTIPATLGVLGEDDIIEINPPGAK